MFGDRTHDPCPASSGIVGDACRSCIGPACFAQQAAQPITIGDHKFFTLGQYGAYASPWSTNRGHENQHYVHGVDYQNNILIRPSSFPNGTIIQSDWPDPVSNRVLGYMHITYGNYDGGLTKVAVSPVRVRDIETFTEDVSFGLVGARAYTTVLGEFYLTRRAGDPAAKVFEIGIFYHASSTVEPFYDAAKPIGNFTDASGRHWDVVNAGANSVGAAYIIFRPSDRRDVLGLVDRKAMLDYLLEQRVITDDLWVNGIAIGIEPHSGSSTFRLKNWSVTLN
jgi:hypothetical protein